MEREHEALHSLRINVLLKEIVLPVITINSVDHVLQPVPERSIEALMHHETQQIHLILQSLRKHINEHSPNELLRCQQSRLSQLCALSH